MSDLNNLPTVETRDTFWYREFWIRDEMIERHFLPEIYWRGLVNFISSTTMKLKCAIAKMLLRGVSDPCPHCHKLIELSSWKNPFEAPHE